MAKWRSIDEVVGRWRARYERHGIGPDNLHHLLRRLVCWIEREAG
jgi:hypothetical protein